MDQPTPRVPVLPRPPNLSKRHNLRIIPPEKRKKVAQACDSCKRKKQRCNGLQPCASCLKRKGAVCQYTLIDRRLLKPTNKEREQRRLEKERNDNAVINNDQVFPSFPMSFPQNYPIPQSIPSNQLPFQYNTPTTIQNNVQSVQPNVSSSININTQLGSQRNEIKEDTILDTSPSYYLFNFCKKTFQRVIGNNEFSNIPELNFIDIPIINEMGARSDSLTREYSNYLLKTFLNNINNVVYVIDDQVVRNLIALKYENPTQLSKDDNCLINMIFTIASVFAKVEVSKKLFPFDSKFYISPEVFLNESLSYLRSREHEINIKWIVEIYLLQYFYYQSIGKRNTAWIKLGHSIRDAQTLGMHRTHINESFNNPTHVLHRRKLFRSLYIVDRAFSLTMGRPIGIEDNNWDDSKFAQAIIDPSTKLLQVAILIGKVISKIYFKHSLKISTALQLINDFKIYSINNPKPPIPKENYSRPLDHRYLLPNMAFSNGLMLISLPFYQLILLTKLNLIKVNQNHIKSIKHLKSLFKLCINSSLLNVKVIEYVFFQNIHPFKPLALICSCVSQAGFVIGSLLLLRIRLGIDDGIFEGGNAILINSMKSAIKLLRTYGEVDEPSLMYSKILQQMMDIICSDDSLTSSNSNLFGDPSSILESNNQEKYEIILNLQSSLFLDFDINDINETTIIDNENDELLHEISKLNNISEPPSSLFTDDFLFKIIDQKTTLRGYRNRKYTY